MGKHVDETDDVTRYLVVGGRRWRREDPSLPEDVAVALRSALGAARSEVGRLTRSGRDPAPARERVSLAKHGLGERGRPWWEQTQDERRDRWSEALRSLGLPPPGADGPR